MTADAGGASDAPTRATGRSLRTDGCSSPSASASASAFVPGHVTGFFCPMSDDDPARAGSTGAGITLTDGVRVTVSPDSERRVELDGAPVTLDAVEHVLDAFDRDVAVDVESDLPVGTGFGVSGAAALGTALATNELQRRLVERNDGAGTPDAADRTTDAADTTTDAVDVPHSENELVRLAHVAEVEAGTGLGDVVAQARGGVPIRVEAGAPPHGTLDGVPATGRIEYLALGELSTREVLGGDTASIEDAGRDALAALRAAPTLPRLLDLSRAFAERAELVTDDVAEILAAVDETNGRSTVDDGSGRTAVNGDGGTATMAMLGRSVVGTGRALSSAGYEPTVCRIATGGARLR